MQDRWPDVLVVDGAVWRKGWVQETRHGLMVGYHRGRTWVTEIADSEHLENHLEALRMAARRSSEHGS